MALDFNDHSGNGNTLTNNGLAEYTASLPFAGDRHFFDKEGTKKSYHLYIQDEGHTFR